MTLRSLIRQAAKQLVLVSDGVMTYAVEGNAREVLAELREAGDDGYTDWCQDHPVAQVGGHVASTDSASGRGARLVALLKEFGAPRVSQSCGRWVL